MKYKHVITNDSITVTGGGRTTTIKSDAPNFVPLRTALLSGDEAEIEQCLDVGKIAEAYSKGNFKVVDGQAYFKGEKVPGDLGRRIARMAAAGDDFGHMLRFWEKLQRNPSWRSVEQLFPFLNHQGIPIIQNGNFLAYKGVNSNYTDKHTGRVDNKPGVVNEMARNKVSDDPKTPCHYGLHVGDLSYARSFASTVVVCEVDPADVVCIPYDESQRKMRVCRYRVRGNHNGELLPSTVYDLEEDIGAGAEVEQDPEELELLEADEENFNIESEDTKDAKREMKELGDAIDALGKHARQVRKKKPQPKERKLKAKRAPNKQARLTVKPKYRKIHAMERRELMDQGIMELREYATQVLHIVGASKIRGGKLSLISVILRTRRNFS